MVERILNRIREKIHNRQYVMTQHARVEMIDDGLSIYDVENAILSGEIMEHQIDKVTAESKYRIKGETFAKTQVEVIVKMSPTGKLVIITVYLILDEEVY